MKPKTRYEVKRISDTKWLVVLFSKFHPKGLTIREYNNQSDAMRDAQEQAFYSQVVDS